MGAGRPLCHAALLACAGALALDGDRPSTNYVPPMGPRVQIDELPVEIIDIGMKVWGSREWLEWAISRHGMKGPLREVVNNVDTLLVSERRDDTLKRVQGEMMNSDYYGVRDIKEEQGVIFDIGANIGDMAINTWMLHPKSKVIALEPIPTTYFYLRLNMWLNNVTALTEADLHDPSKAGVLALNMAANADGNSVQVRWNRRDTQEGVTGSFNEAGVSMSPSRDGLDDGLVLVKGLDVNEFIRKHHLAPITLFKIDCEGCEFEVLPTIDALMADKQQGIQRFAAEIHQNKRPDHKDQHKHMAMKATDKQVADVDRILALRGCDGRKWANHC